jgi:hypothetical protein
MGELNAGSAALNALSFPYILLSLLIIWPDATYIEAITWKRSIYRVINSAGLNPWHKMSQAHVSMKMHDTALSY